MRTGLVILEGKSVEEQMANTLQQPAVDPGKHPSEGFVSEDARRAADQVRTVKERQMQALNLQ
jgi:hypothetical protein